MNIFRSIISHSNIAANNNPTINNIIMASDFSGGILNGAIQPISGTNTSTATNANINVFRSLISHSNIPTNNNSLINNNNNNNVLASEFSGGISNQAMQPQPLSGTNTITASNAHINNSRSLNAHLNIAINNNNNTIQPSGEIQEAQFVKTQFNKILSKFFFYF
jgi:hypothetical protein